MAFNSSSGFHLPNGANRSPDAAWVKLNRWEALTPEEQSGFAPICPDFVVERRSKPDNMEPLRAKMREYLENQACLGWLIDRKNRKVEIYRQEQDVEVLDNHTTLSGENVLPGFVLDLTSLVAIARSPPHRYNQLHLPSCDAVLYLTSLMLKIFRNC